MARTSKKTIQKKTQTPQFSPQTVNILIGIFLVTISILAFFASTETNQLGQKPLLWQYFSIAGKWLFWEHFIWIFSPILLFFGATLIAKKTYWDNLKLIGIIVFYISTTSLLGWYQNGTSAFFDTYKLFEGIIGGASTIILMFVLFLVSLYILFQISYQKILSNTYNSISQVASDTVSQIKTETKIEPKITKNKKTEDTEYSQKWEKISAELAAIQEKKTQDFIKQQDTKTEEKTKTETSGMFRNLLWKQNNSDEKKIPVHTTSWEIIEKKETIKLSDIPAKTYEWWDFPSVQLLAHPPQKNTISPEEIQEKALIIQKTLLDFRIEVEMEKSCVGPTVIQYRLKPADGVKVSRIVNLKDDLTLALSAKSIRIQAPIPGLGLIGIEVPNEKRDIVTIREVLESQNFIASKSKLALALGKDINGDFIVWDLAKMPHLLIAGQTGSGKSVGMNGFILSMLYKNTPSELRMIMVDPKQVELGVYDGIPHLLTPVINSTDKAINALRWTVAEMERRLGVFKQINARNLDEFNAKSDQKEPFIVVIIDELADLMMSGNKKEVELMITRIAQKARAAGIHLILATQRPSVDIITGLIKANVPSRVAFTVASQVDSRTILDQIGAEDLLGRGDMLYMPTGANASRIQWVLVETEEVENVVRHIRLAINPDDYPPQISNEELNWSASEWNWEGSVGTSGNLNEDPQVIEKAILLVREEWKCSTSMLQRHLNLGYGRAARVVDILEKMNIVGPANGSKPRDVL